ncbi:iron complex outermembrane recepter protein [Chitinophaga terrae (ex Kim and Jung 2007)]|uniref:Iron complex outermembrane recepter protein n=1 Tax=Chitinophaga terrae (ex Kim and Jung 2007) TaxID=408074 RepID=A0A1H3YAM8_9BACT|nr:TonB-dependent receptor [Chitinophaga terrae (ex Kim and Jung 2007)]GEP90850.1 collagen-binding protein [Chitinophaga terrae (ex Kim and Jung 2007)]SEA08586.1 iron complex outermembrane recepter protein [Chitinophaga terrae (ex Kim and Jung 2007)]
MKVKLYALAVLLLLSDIAFAQSIQGTISDKNQPLIGASVRVIGSNTGTVTNSSGHFSLTLKPGTYKLSASYIGYQALEKEVTVVSGQTATVDFQLTSAEGLNEVVVLGSRSAPRSQLTTAVPVDVVDIKQVAQTAPQVSINQILNYVAPSFSSNTQTLSDGTDHIDPASLRGLGPDQVLVLINGKRRHTTSLVNINGSFGKGSVGTDLNAIPTAAIKRIEILRDGAAAQYGSDAIAGVINIVLNDDVNRLNASVTTGGFVSKNAENGLDGQTVQANLNYGLPLGTKGGYINLSGSYDYRNAANRGGIFTGTIFSDYNDPALADVPGSPKGKDITEQELAKRGLTRKDFNTRIGQSANRGGTLFLNASLPVSENAEVYAFGGLNYRHGEAVAFYRMPAQLTQNNDTIYPNGFLPQIVTDNRDRSLAAGIRGKLGEWKVDFSNTYGENGIDFTVANTLNASMLKASPTSFKAGGYRFLQNTTNLDFSRFFEQVLSGLNVAYGAEHRFEKYQILPGSEASYTNYGNARNIGTGADGRPILIPDPSGNVSTRFAANGSAFAGGAQSFTGFSPVNAISAYRTSIAVYGDVEANFTSKFLVDGALRFENYSDFGSTLNWKIASRYQFSPKFLLRAAASTGFRAPSLHQRYFSATSSIFTDGVFVESGTFTNDSRVAALLGIPKLKQETSYSYSAGITSNLGPVKITVDGYFIRINDRIVYTGQFSGNKTGTPQEQEIYNILRSANAQTARFFANAINTETRGIDAVITYTTRAGKGHFRADLSGTLAKTSLVGPVHASPLLAGKESTYFDEASRIYLESAVPQTKANLTLNYNISKWGFFLRNVYFGKVTEATNVVANQDVYSGKVITDLSVSYAFIPALRLTIGANNLLDVYPDELSVANSSSGRFLYSRASQQFGFNGRFLFARLNLSF